MNQRNNKDNNQFSSGKGLSLYISICAAKGLQEIMKNNLGPNGTMKILVSTSGEIKISKDGSYLLKEMQIQNPTASLIAKTVISQKSYIGDGATSTIILIGEALRNIEKYLEKGVHPQVLCDGIDLTRMEIEKWLPTKVIDKTLDRKTLLNCAKTVIETKICNEGKIMDLERIEMLQINTRTESDSKWIRGIVLDHGARHPDMPKIIHNAFILLCNINLEYERPTTNSTINYDSIEDREKISLNERELIDKRVKNIIQLKRNRSYLTRSSIEGGYSRYSES
jgi:T-complex protein 1 subunit zeta